MKSEVQKVTAFKQKSGGRQRAPAKQPTAQPVEVRVIVLNDTPTQRQTESTKMKETPANPDVTTQKIPGAPRQTSKERSAARDIPLDKVKTLDFSSVSTADDKQHQSLRNVALANSWIQRHFANATSAKDEPKKTNYPSRGSLKKAGAEDGKGKVRKPTKNKWKCNGERRKWMILKPLSEIVRWSYSVNS